MTEVVNEKESLLNNVDKPDISLNVCQPVKKKKKKRCFHCKAKLPIINYPCKCGYVFCYQHLNAHSHNCTYDYSKERKEELTKNIMKVVCQKVEKMLHILCRSATAVSQSKITTDV